MDKKGVAELKRRFTKENCTFTRLCGCYVDAGKNKVVDFSENFLNLEDEEFYKYLEIAKKSLSGTVGNNLLELQYPLEEEAAGGRQQFLLGLRESRLQNPELLERFFDMVIENYDYAGNYLILLFHDAYDVITKTKDNLTLDESEEVFEYLLCAICPVQLSKPGLGYREEENRIGPRIRDWVVGVPDTGFLFPAFTDRSADIHALMFYTKDTKEPHSEFMEAGLGCPSRRTATEQKIAFHGIVKQAYGGDTEKSQDVLMDIQQNLNERIEAQEEDEEPVVLTKETMTTVLEESGVEPERLADIEKKCEETFGEELPLAASVVDGKDLAANEQLQRQKELTAQVESLQQQLKEKQMEEDETEDAVKTYDVVLRVKPEKVPQIKSQVIDGQKCLVIPMDENEHANVNGRSTTV
ncbi:MAG: DUF4317 domain-containing protein [Lachnospiraceae bacterium]|nr:DUF4317 domain-containing protein [Lachnospiraceae bacterium]